MRDYFLNVPLWCYLDQQTGTTNFFKTTDLEVLTAFGVFLNILTVPRHVSILEREKDREMGSVSNCVVCSESDSSATFVPVISSRTAASDVLLAFKLFEVIGLEALDGVICSVCLDLLEQIDFFEQNAASSKEKIKQRKDRVPDKGEVRFKEEKLAEDEDEEATFDASGVVDDDVDEEEEEVVVKRRKKKRGKRCKQCSHGYITL